MGLLKDNKPFEQESEETNAPVKDQNANTENNNNASQDQNAGGDDGGMSDLLAGLQNKTDKDEQGGAGNNNPGQNNPGANNPGANNNTVRRSGIHYSNHELVAQLTIAALSVSMGLILQYIAQDWTEDAERRYTLSGARKKELQEPLTLMLEQSKSKYNPAIIFFITVLVAYVPMFIGAFRIRKLNTKLKKANSKLPPGQKLQYTDDIKDTVMDEAHEREQKKPEPQKKVGQQFTKAQLDRIKKIKSKRGNRSKEDKDFIAELGLTGLV